VSRTLLASAGISSRRFGLAARLAVIGALFIAEKILLSTFVDFERAQEAEGFGAIVRLAQHWGFRFLVSLAAATAAIAYVHADMRLRTIDMVARQTPRRGGWWLAHVLLLAVLIPLSYLLYRESPVYLPFPVIAGSWIVVAAGAGASAFAALAPWSVWKAGAVALGGTWPYSVAVAVLGASAMPLSQRLWGPTAELTFALVRRVLAPLMPTLSVDSANLVLGTSRFSVQISEICSGLEGMGLISAFCIAWLLYFRRDYRFPRALLLIPIGLLIIFALNVLRIAALVLIGDAGFPVIAAYGFHSQAGWIAFNLAACGLCYFTRRDTWFNRANLGPTAGSETENPTAAFVMPLLAVLAAATVARATASDFEHFAPLELLAGAGTLTVFWSKLATLNWRWSWRGPAVGLAVFLVWIAAAHYLLPPIGAPYKLSVMAAPWRWGWLASQLGTSVVVTPIVEELAYRGYFMRRLCSKDFESVLYRSVGSFALLVSALAFGLLHSNMWLPATLAGVAFGALIIKRERIGEAVMAHAVSNGLIAATVLGWNQWQFW
jgi:exosortase E/protease (VPEID-CTERM system)